MEISEFIAETSRIENFFEKELTNFQRDIWYQELKDVPINRYRQIVKKAFSECKFMPKLADITAINKELPYGNNEKKGVEKVDCDKCNGLGVIPYKKIITNGNQKIEYEYFARCNCQNASQFVYDGTIINDTNHRSKFYIASVEQLGL